MARVVVAYNKRSSRASEISERVLGVLKEREDLELYEFEVKRASVAENARRLVRVLRDGDVVVSAGGDGTATATLNGVVLSKKKVKFAALPYGNFNDTARLFKTRKVSEILENLENTQELYPLEMLVNGRHYRYAACYFTVGMLAESTRAFNDTEVRKSLVSGRRSLVFSILTLFSWWRKNRKKAFLPTDLKATDILAVNGRSVARIMRGDSELAFSDVGFLASKQKLSGFLKTVWFVMRGMIFRVPGKVADSVKVGFLRAFEVEIQAEGEYERKKCRKIEIRKSQVPVEVICK